MHRLYVPLNAQFCQSKVANGTVKLFDFSSALFLSSLQKMCVALVLLAFRTPETFPKMLLMRVLNSLTEAAFRTGVEFLTHPQDLLLDLGKEGTHFSTE